MDERKILVVDDDREIRESLVELLSCEGFNAASACDGESALEFLRQSVKPSLILLDALMPRMSGYDVLKRIRDKPDLCHIPVIVLSASAPNPELLPGSTVFIRKPVEVDYLLEVIKSRLAE